MKALKLKGWVDGILGHRTKAQISTVHWFAVKPVPDMVKATLVIGEKAYTESEVRAMLHELREELKVNCRWQGGVEVISASAMRQAFHRDDVRVFFDPA